VTDSIVSRHLRIRSLKSSGRGSINALFGTAAMYAVMHRSRGTWWNFNDRVCESVAGTDSACATCMCECSMSSAADSARDFKPKSILCDCSMASLSRLGWHLLMVQAISV
jgi:hypothetical protein